MTLAPSGSPGAEPETAQRRVSSRPVLSFLAVVVAGIALSIRLIAPAAQTGRTPPALYVYLQTDTKVAELERVLKAQLSGLKVTVFGRFRDFEEAMLARPPEAVMGLNMLLTQQGVRPSLQGLRDKQDAESYALVSVGTPLDLPVAGKTIGAVDLLGREGTQSFVATLVGSANIKVKRVTKSEDLLALLQFAAVDAVLVPKLFVNTLAERSRMPLRARDLGGVRIKLPAIGVRDPAARPLVLQQIQNLDRATNQILGVDEWRTQ